MCLLGLLNQSTAAQYNGEVLQRLIPLLSSHEATSTNEILLATTVVLRMAEQFSELEQDTQSHLKGAVSLFMDGTNWPLAEHNLGIAAFWTHLRELIRICFLREQPPEFALDQLSITDNHPRADAPEEEWTNRSTYLMLKVCKLCWGGSADKTHAALEEVRTSLDLWKQKLPQCFSPWSVRETTDHPFPAIKYFESWHGEFHYLQIEAHKADELQH